MQHAHEQGLVHRDLKPSNLFLEIPEGMAGAAQLPTPGGRVKVLDLGLARVLPMKDHPSAALTRLSADGVVMGTPDYLAPEQALAAHGVDIRADIYSLGCTLFELLTGQPPFGEGSMTQKLLAHQHDPPPPLENFRTDAPWELAALLRRALAKKPADRFATPGALAAALTPFTRLSPLTPVVVRPSARTIVSTKRRMEAEERSGHDLLRPTLNTMVASVTAPPSSVADELAGFAAEPVVLTGHLGGVYCAAAGSDRRTAVTGGEDRLLVVWDLEAGTRVGLLRGHRDQIACASVSPDGRTAAAGDYDHAVVLWDLERGVEKFRLHGHSGPVATAVFTPDGRRLVTGGLDQAVQIWDVDDGKLVRGLGGLVTDRHWGPVLTAAITPSGELAMTAGRDRSIRLWDLQTGRQAACLLGHRHSIYCLAISPDGRRAASGGGDHSVCIWDIADGKKIGELEGHTRSVRSAAFLDEGRLLATGGDNTWRLWDVAAGRQLGCWAGNPETVLAVVPTGDGVLVVGNDRYVRYWRRSP
jgi:WD40 repeat protein